MCIYILLVLLAADTTELHQLFKRPVLFQHYAEHKQLDDSVSFTEFLSMHYWGNDLNDNDNDRDMQLPFKKLDAHAPHFVFAPTLRAYITRSPGLRIIISYAVYQHQYFPNPALSSPFRPPCA